MILRFFDRINYFIIGEHMKKILIVISIIILAFSAVALSACAEDENNVYGIYVSTPPNKTVYYAGEKLDVEGMEITVKTRDRNDYSVTVTPQMVSGFSSALGNHTLTITYTVGGAVFTTTQVITVSARKALSAVVTQQPKNTTFIEGQQIDLSGLIAEVTFSDGSVQERPYTAFVRNKAFAELGLTEVELKLDSVVLKVTIEVLPKRIIGLKATKLPDKTEYVEGELFDPTGLIVYNLYNDGDLESMIDYEVIDAEKPLEATQTSVKIKDKYSSEFVLEIPVTVKANSIKSISINQETVRKNYITGSLLDFKDLEAVITFNDDRTKTVGFDSLLFDVSLDEPLTVGEKTIAVRYKYATDGSVSDSFVIIVSDEKLAFKITVETTAEFISSYNDGETISLLGLAVTVYFNDGTSVRVIYADEINTEVEDFSYTSTADAQNPYIEFRCGNVSERVAITVITEDLDENATKE